MPTLMTQKLRMSLDPQDQGEFREDLHQLEQECQRTAPQYAAAYSVLRENLEDLHMQEYQRSAPQPRLLNSVQGENLENLTVHHLHNPELECRCSAHQSAAEEQRRTRSSVLPPTVLPSADDAEPNAAGYCPGRSWAHR